MSKPVKNIEQIKTRSKLPDTRVKQTLTTRAKRQTGSTRKPIATEDNDDKKSRVLAKSFPITNTSYTSRTKTTELKKTKPASSSSMSSAKTVGTLPTKQRLTANPSNGKTKTQYTPIKNMQLLQAKRKSGNENADKTPKKPNAVLNTFQNVTVLSPPMKRKEIPIEMAEPSSETRARTLTITLDPKEVVVLKKHIAESRNNLHGVVSASPVQEAVAFEVNFDQTKPKSVAKLHNPQCSIAVSKTSPDSSPSEYDDDFESYESDFETGSSSNGIESENGPEYKSYNSDRSCDSSATSTNGSIISADEDEISGKKSIDSASEDESELTQYPITVIQREREHERKLDSGNYDLNSKNGNALIDSFSFSAHQHQQQQPQQFDSVETFSGINTEQLDSGISYGTITTKSTLEEITHSTAIYGGYSKFMAAPVMSQRGLELMTKIQFDALTFELFEQKPISYDAFMQTYGRLNTTQSSAQTNQNQMTADCQTDECDTRSIWTQHPPQYDLQMVQKLSGPFGETLQNCCGEFANDDYDQGCLKSPLTTDCDPMEQSLLSLRNFRHSECHHRSNDIKFNRQQKPVDFDRLNIFLLNSSLLVARILNESSSNTKSHLDLKASQFDASISGGFYKLGTRLLNALRVVRVFANPRFNMVLTVHESIAEAANVYCSDFSNLIMVWSASEGTTPIRLLSSWSEVCRAHICNSCSEIIVCGLRDGSVAMWDLRETHSYCSKLDGHLTHFPATQSIVPCWSGGGSRELFDLGAAVDIKSFRSSAKTIQTSTRSSYMPIQFVSLNDSGILTVWTLVEIGGSKNNFETLTSRPSKISAGNSKFEYNSPWARVKLTQSAICDLREYLELRNVKIQSNFENTKSHFQKNIFSDEVLRELNETHTKSQHSQCVHGLRFSSIDTGCDQIFVCTNRNYILVCSKSLTAERFRKITVNDSRFLHPTALKLLTNEEYLAVGLSNGSVIILNCSRSKSSIIKEFQRTRPSTTSAAGHRQKVEDIIDLENGKSCAIQNIIRNERRLLKSIEHSTAKYDSRPNTATDMTTTNVNVQKKPFELKIFDQQILLNGSVLRRNLVQELELSSDGWKLFALSDGEVRIYDFFLEREIHNADGASKLNDIAVAKGSAADEQHLLLLDKDNDVQVHFLKRFIRTHSKFTTKF